MCRGRWLTDEGRSGATGGRAEGARRLDNEAGIKPGTVQVFADGNSMASLRGGTRRDGSTYVQVLYRLDGKQSSTSFKTWLQPTSSRSWSRNSGRQKH
jgi:hypothetical protein